MDLLHAPVIIFLAAVASTHAADADADAESTFNFADWQKSDFFAAETAHPGLCKRMEREAHRYARAEATGVAWSSFRYEIIHDDLIPYEDGAIMIWLGIEVFGSGLSPSKAGEAAIEACERIIIPAAENNLDAIDAPPNATAEDVPGIQAVEPLPDVEPMMVSESLQTDQDDLGQWRIRHSIDPIDDSAVVVISLLADEGRSRRGQPISFVARCRSNTTEAYAVWHDYVGDDSYSTYSDFKHVTVRIGETDAETQEWNVSTDKKATFAPAWAGDILKR